MNWMALLGILFIAYALFVFFLIFTHKPENVWQMGKIQGFIKILGNTGTTILFVFFGIAIGTLGVWFMLM